MDERPQRVRCRPVRVGSPHPRPSVVDERGASLVEYVLLVAAIAVACIVSVAALGGSTLDQLEQARAGLASITGGGGGPAPSTPTTSTPTTSTPTTSTPVTSTPTTSTPANGNPGGGNPGGGNPGGGNPGGGNPGGGNPGNGGGRN